MGPGQIASGSCPQRAAKRAGSRQIASGGNALPSLVQVSFRAVSKRMFSKTSVQGARVASSSATYRRLLHGVGMEHLAICQVYCAPCGRKVRQRQDDEEQGPRRCSKLFTRRPDLCWPLLPRRSSAPWGASVDLITTQDTFFGPGLRFSHTAFSTLTSPSSRDVHWLHAIVD